MVKKGEKDEEGGGEGEVVEEGDPKEDGEDAGEDKGMAARLEETGFCLLYTSPSPRDS